MIDGMICSLLIEGDARSMLHYYIVGFDSFWKSSNDISRLLIEGDVRDLGICILLEWA